MLYPFFARIWDDYLVLSHVRGTLGLSGHEQLHVTPYPHELLALWPPLLRASSSGESSLESTGLGKKGLGEL